MRASNLAAIRLGENLNKPGGPDTPYLLVFPDYDVKNQVDLTFELDEYVTAVIDEYVHDYRPALMRGSNEDWLFPGGEGGAKDAHLFGIQITERIQKVTGLRITLHQYRHAAAAVYLKHHPGDYETVRRFLGHRNIRTTVKFYCGLETIQATRMLGDVVRQHRKIEPTPTRPVTGHEGEEESARAGRTLSARGAVAGSRPCRLARGPSSERSPPTWRRRQPSQAGGATRPQEALWPIPGLLVEVGPARHECTCRGASHP